MVLSAPNGTLLNRLRVPEIDEVELLEVIFFFFYSSSISPAGARPTLRQDTQRRQSTCMLNRVGVQGPARGGGVLPCHTVSRLGRSQLQLLDTIVYVYMIMNMYYILCIYTIAIEISAIDKHDARVYVYASVDEVGLWTRALVSQ